MRKEHFLQMLGQVNQKMIGLTKTKGEEYTRSDDQLANFRRAADEAGITMEQAWLVFFNKHVDSIKSHIKNGCKDNGSEPIMGRIDDAVLYLMLFRAMVIERAITKPEKAWSPT